MKRKDMRNAIIEVVYEISAEIGLGNVTTKKISVAAKTSENVIYNYFSSKVELLEAAFFETNCEIDAAMKESFLSITSIGKVTDSTEISLLLWDTYLNYFVSNPTKTIFYDQYIHSAYISNEVWARQSQSFVFFTQLVTQLRGNIASLSTDLESFVFLIMLVINSAIMLAINSIRTERPIPDKAKGIITNFIKMIFINN